MRRVRYGSGKYNNINNTGTFVIDLDENISDPSKTLIFIDYGISAKISVKEITNTNFTVGPVKAVSGISSNIDIFWTIVEFY